MPNAVVQNLIIMGAYLPILITALYAGRYYRALSPSLKAFSWFLWVSSVIQGGPLLFWKLNLNNMVFLHLYLPLGFGLLTRFYQRVFEGFIRPRILWGTAIGFTLFSALNSFLWEPWRTYNATANAIEGILLTIFSLATFLFLLQEVVREHKGDEHKPISWINSGLFIYYSSTLLLFYFGNILNDYQFSVELSKRSWMIHSFFAVVEYSCFGIGLWKQVHR